MILSLEGIKCLLAKLFALSQCIWKCKLFFWTRVLPPTPPSFPASSLTLLHHCTFFLYPSPCCHYHLWIYDPSLHIATITITSTIITSLITSHSFISLPLLPPLRLSPSFLSTLIQPLPFFSLHIIIIVTTTLLHI